jgi:ABC-2 type transport system permease protein
MLLLLTQKRSAIITLITIPLLMSFILVLLTKYLSLKAAIADLTSVSTSFAVNSFWVSSVAILLSIGLIPKEVDSGTMAWNLTKALSRTSFLLGKWLATTLMTWLIAIVLANFIALLVNIILFGWTTLRFNEVITAHFAAFCHIGFWVLLSLLLGLLLKDQAAVGAGAIILSVCGNLLPYLPDERWRWIIPFYPTNTVDWALSSDATTKLIAYFVYMLGMAIAAKFIFDRKEFS